jgi:quinol monooxygenase YgiN
VDEWDSPERFEAFFGDHEMQAFVGSVGADPTASPDITVAEAITSPDEF